MAMKGKTHTAVEIGADGVAVITIDNPPLNLLSVDVMLSLKDSIEKTLPRGDVKAVVITGSNGKFSAGFDVTTLGGSQARKTQKELGFLSVDFVTDTLEAARKPMVAAIGGFAFGGGLEIALACHARISTPSAQLGLTELQYGILPGLGGTQRLPRLVGLHKALEMILMSKRVRGEEARTLSLVDAVVPANKLLGTARQWALDIANFRRPWIISLYKTDKFEALAEARAILKSVRTKIQKETPNLMHQVVCIDVIEHGIVSGPRTALWKEAEALQELRQSSTFRSLVHIFFAQRQITKIPGITDMHCSPRKIKEVGIIGGGYVGSGIATILILNDFHVVLKEKDSESLSYVTAKIKADLQTHVKRGNITQDKLKRAYSSFTGVLDYERFNHVDLVIEAEPECMSHKQQIFADLEKCCPYYCIFASTTFSSLNLIGDRLKSQNRIVGTNFLCPSLHSPLMEIVSTTSTSLQVIVDLMDFIRKMKKTPIVIRNCAGFTVTRIFVAYLHASLLLAERGADIYRIDQAITKFGISLGPFRMADAMGLPFASLTSKMSGSSYQSALLSVIQQDGCEGERNCSGFYVYHDTGDASPNPQMPKYIEKSRKMSGTTIDSKLLLLSDEDIVEMVLFPAVDEVCRIISEGIAFRTSDLDIASVMGIGFPAYRGGIIFWSDSFGSGYICSRLQNWSKEYGEFFKPCAYLVELASNGISLGRQAKPRL